jgi:CRISPR system Cascade subunit CasD
MRRLEDYHTATGIRRASGKVDDDATVQTYRHYLLDARFGALLDGPLPLLAEIAGALRDPKWGVWFGRKSCLPASPVLAAGPDERTAVWTTLLIKAGLLPTLKEEDFDRVLETIPDDPGADCLDDSPMVYGAPIGNRHAPRWIRVVPRSGASPVKE